ncbi:hypothetical protein VOLCADRAFT_99512 [Volvox carteri f. nagariensis]|uniref:Uncharacterized protein n=1 Tax=Volvox carteri f. nagariensis TaxID=3068 RepID=D8UHY7_VOLCA|nr:uncharacterized protein VOLCADRAFT_99512 [Volvox carteri f. nagariensis]EFJ40643.1 hypothetical protein VOLCADRAFT_99512 [Volvox carteri f. nagariensis]|eukprot:XP_002958269.1 hypothetical protein VOLCADRAFT_99512 [Volvox carteri f. nagariensis]
MSLPCPASGPSGPCINGTGSSQRHAMDFTGTDTSGLQQQHKPQPGTSIIEISSDRSDDDDGAVFTTESCQPGSHPHPLPATNLLLTFTQSTTLDVVKQWATDVGGGDCNSHDDSKGLKAQPFCT